MTCEIFLQQVNLAEQLTSSDFGVSTGLISQGYWEMSKWYFVNVERGNIADKLQPRNINVSFTKRQRTYRCNNIHIDDDDPFIVLTETKFSIRYIPVWARYSPLRTRVKAHALTMTLLVHW
jgi:hypothetical protein